MTGADPIPAYNDTRSLELDVRRVLLEPNVQRVVNDHPPVEGG